MASNAIKVFIKVRPLIAREKNENANSMWNVTGNTMKSTDKQYEMTFDNIFDESRTTQELFDDLAKPIVTSALKGINGTIFAYGQTSSGKTFTMMGDDTNPGIIPLTVNEIFDQIENNDDREFLVRFGYIEIYNEKIFDLLQDKKPELLKLHERENTGEVTVNQREIVAVSVEQILASYNDGNKARRTGETNMNERSSRSHTIFRITIESREVGKTCEESAVQVSNLNLVDLAGSERADQTKSEGDRLKEGGHINKSLLALGNVIRLLSEDISGTAYINFRDSKLTRLLSASLGGNAMTSIICTVTPAALDETYSTLIFAQNAKKIKNKPKVNEVMTDQAIMKRMQREIEKLKDELDNEKQSRHSELQKINELNMLISLKEGQFLHSHNVTSTKAADLNRRRTWCPSSNTLPVQSIQPSKHTGFLTAAPPFFVEPSLRSSAPGSEFAGNDYDEEVFVPSDQINLDRTLSPGGRNTETLSNLIHTPREMKSLRTLEDSPNPMKLNTLEAALSRINYLEGELRELNDFTKLENTVDVDHKKLSQKLSYANDHIASLELKIEELQNVLVEKDRDAELLRAGEEREKALKAKTQAENILESIKYEQELFAAKAKKRENELVQSLEEARGGSKSSELLEKVRMLEEKLQKSEELLFKMQAPAADIKAGGDANEKMIELEQLLAASEEEREKLLVSLKDKRNEAARILSDYNETSNQVMDLIQENDDLRKKLDEFNSINAVPQLDETKENEIDELTTKCELIDGILNNIMNDDELPSIDNFDNDKTIQEMMQLREGIIGCRENEEYLNELVKKVEELTTENENLKLKLPTIEEINESESELKDKVDALAFELSEAKVQLEIEVATAKEAENTVNELKEKLEVADVANQSLNEQVMSLQSELESKAAHAEIEQRLHASDEKQAKQLTEIQRLQQELDGKSEKVKQLEDALSLQQAELTAEISDLKQGLQQVMSLGEENARLKQTEKEHKRLVNELTHKMDDIQRRSEELKLARERLEVQSQRIDELTKNEANVKGQIDELESQVSHKSGMIARLQSENEALEDKVDKLEQSLEKKSFDSEMLQDMEDKLAELNDELKHTLENEKVAKELNLDLEIQFRELQDELKQQTDEQIQVHEQLEARVAELAEKSERVIELQEKLKLSSENQAKAIEQSTSLETSIGELQEKISQLQLQLHEKSKNESASTNTSQDFETLAQTAFSEQTEELRAQLKDSQEKIASLQAELEANKSNITQDTRDEKLSSLEQEISTLIDDATKSQEEMARLESDMKQLISEKTKADETVTDMKSEIENLNLKRDESLAELSRAEQEVEKLRIALKDAQMTTDSSAGELEVFKSKFEELQSHLTTKERSIKILESYVNDKNQEIAELQNSVESSNHKDEIDKLKKQSSEVVQQQEAAKALLTQICELQAELTAIKTEKSVRDTEFDAMADNLQKLMRESDDANKRYNSLLSEHSTIDGINTTLNSKLLLVNEEMSQLRQELNVRTNECDEIKLRYKRRSLDNDKKFGILEKDMTGLLQKIGAIEAAKAVVEQELRKFKVEHIQIVEKLQSENDRLQNASNDNDMKFAVLDEKYSQLKEANEKIQADFDALSKLQKPQFDSLVKTNHRLEQEIEELNEKISQYVSESFVSTKTIADLRDERDVLASQIEETNKSGKKPSSPETRDKQRTSNELYVSQNQQILMEARATPTRAITKIVERKTRRQSVHDEHRRLSVWEQFTNTSVQTDPVSEICACNELTQKVKELQIEVRKRDCKISTMERLAQHNPIKLDLEEKVKTLAREQREHHQTKANLEAISRNVMKLEAKIEVLSKNQKVKKELVERAIQSSSDLIVDKSEYDQLEGKLSELKRTCRQRQEKIDELEEAIGKEKENVGKNINKLSEIRVIESENLTLKKKLHELENKLQTDDGKLSAKSELDKKSEEFEKLQKKYDMTRRLCNLRNDDLNKLKLEQENLKDSYEKLNEELQKVSQQCEVIKIKYAQAKLLCQFRLEKLNVLRAKYGEPVTEE